MLVIVKPVLVKKLPKKIKKTMLESNVLDPLCYSGQ